MMNVEEALKYWRIVTGREKGHVSFRSTHHATVDALDALGQEVERLAPYAALPPWGAWRGSCGHTWDRPRGDASDADCPLCALQRRVTELQRGGSDASQ